MTTWYFCKHMCIKNCIILIMFPFFPSEPFHSIHVLKYIQNTKSLILFDSVVWFLYNIIVGPFLMNIIFFILYTPCCLSEIMESHYVRSVLSRTTGRSPRSRHDCEQCGADAGKTAEVCQSLKHTLTMCERIPILAKV